MEINIAGELGTYQCANCGGTFEETRPKEEAMQDFVAKYGEGPKGEPLDVLCDECYDEFEKWWDGLPAEQRAEMEAERANQRVN